MMTTDAMLNGLPGSLDAWLRFVARKTWGAGAGAGAHTEAIQEFAAEMRDPAVACAMQPVVEPIPRVRRGDPDSALSDGRRPPPIVALRSQGIMHKPSRRLCRASCGMARRCC
jgi:hypothetical protein